MRIGQENSDIFGSGLDEGGFGDEPEKTHDAKRGNQVSHELYLSAENSEAEISQLKKRIGERSVEFEQNLGKLNSLVESEDCPAPLRERVLLSIDTVGKRMMDRFKMQFGGSAAAGGAMALYELAAGSGASMAEGSLLVGGAGSVALAGAALYASLKGLQFARYKIQEMMVKHGVKKGTIKGMGDAAAFLNDAKSQGHGELSDISEGELQAMFDQENEVFKKEEEFISKKHNESDGYFLTDSEIEKAYKLATKRISHELSEL